MHRTFSEIRGLAANCEAASGVCVRLSDAPLAGAFLAARPKTRKIKDFKGTGSALNLARRVQSPQSGADLVRSSE